MCLNNTLSAVLMARKALKAGDVYPVDNLVSLLFWTLYNPLRLYLYSCSVFLKLLNEMLAACHFSD